MKKIAIVSCDNWKEKIKEDCYLSNELNKSGYITEIISWQDKSVNIIEYDALILRSVWGYQNEYTDFKNWLMNVKRNNILMFNSPDMVFDNINKDIQFNILKNNNLPFVETYFVDNNTYGYCEVLKVINEHFKNCKVVIKPSISGSGENTYLIDDENKQNIPNCIQVNMLKQILKQIYKTNNESKLMIQPFISSIKDGEFSCIYIDGILTHTMIRYPNVFHEKKRPIFTKNIPEEILFLSKQVEKVPEFKDYLYMRVDMVIDNNMPKIMEVELAEPDLLTKYINDEEEKEQIIKTIF